MKALIVGTGAVGGFYGALLAKAGWEVAVVSRSDHDTVAANGIHIRSTLGEWTFRPAAVYRKADEAETPPDYVILCTKVLPDIDRTALIRGAVGPDTTIVLIQNGVEIEAEVAAAFPENALISGLAFVCVSRTGPGQVWHQAYGNLMLGDFPAGIGPRVETLADAFNRSGIRAKAVAEVVAARWRKCVWNAPFNPLSVLSGGLYTADILESQEGFVRTLMQEVCAIAAACGHPLPDAVIDRNIDDTYKMPPYKTSMLLDFEAGRPMETEAILGNAVRAARREGVAVPHLESVYALMKLRELQLERYGCP
ncbi:2-dehydropantoate 2-reductase [Methylomarinovum caldicuralii]|uniref:2-dehydropantoate 2-reductase n=1 Tax=Methylomarinovum caldicuralii TaxID=438856 RepID=A0AAU9CB57_9GAMM|nr:2-dehydropantoate 2-reductase [Methylomarinovum caldicuralii]BCX82866.1 2-dehydropantoate 2-reductase [Methylomarinovum caldicuralii]